MKLFQIRLEQEKNFQTWHHEYRNSLFVCHRCLFVCHITELPSYPDFKHRSYSYSNVCLSITFIFPRMSKNYALVLPEGRAGGAVGAHPASYFNKTNFQDFEAKKYKNLDSSLFNKGLFVALLAI